MKFESEYLEDKESLLTVVREIYKTWRHLQRFGLSRAIVQMTLELIL